MADLELELAQFSFSSAIRGHHVYRATHRMRIVNKCGYIYCSRATTITLSSCSVRRLFEGSVYSGCGVYSRKYGNPCAALARAHHVTYAQLQCSPSRSIEARTYRIAGYFRLWMKKHFREKLSYNFRGNAFSSAKIMNQLYGN